MNRTLSESSEGDHSTRSGSGSGRPGSQKRQQQPPPRLNRSMSSGYTTGSAAAAVRLGVGSPPIYAERDPRLRTLAEPDGGEFGENYGNFRDISESPPLSSSSSLSSKRSSRGQRPPPRGDSMFRERSIDSGSGSADGDLTAAGTSPPTAPGTSSVSSPANAFKSIWKKTVDRLVKKIKTDGTASETAAASAAAAATGSTAEAAQQDPETGVGEVDPVYSFLKLTSVMPRQGTTNVIPGQGHRCCPGSKANGELNDIAIDDTTYTHSNDPSRCQCPCHLPERLDAYRYEWQRAFVIKKTM